MASAAKIVSAHVIALGLLLALTSILRLEEETHLMSEAVLEGVFITSHSRLELWLLVDASPPVSKVGVKAGCDSGESV